MSYLFSSESVSEGHPDKVADQISDAILDQFLAYDSKARVACESFVTTGQVVIMGEVRSEVYIDLQTIARNTIKKIGYTKAEYQFDGNSCGILSAIHEQSSDINQGVDREDEDNQGAGDQGMMFGYATNETENYMPVSLDLAHLIMSVLAEIRKEGKNFTAEAWDWRYYADRAKQSKFAFDENEIRPYLKLENVPRRYVPPRQQALWHHLHTNRQHPTATP